MYVAGVPDVPAVSLERRSANPKLLTHIGANKAAGNPSGFMLAPCSTLTGVGIRTSAGGLRLVPLGVIGVHALDGDGPLLQGVAGVAGELHHGAHRPSGVAAGQVSVLDEGLVAVANGEGCGAKRGGRLNRGGANREVKIC